MHRGDLNDLLAFRPSGTSAASRRLRRSWACHSRRSATPFALEERLGLRPTNIQILPGGLVVGDTAEEAREKRALLDSLVHPDSGIASLSIALGCYASQFDLDGPLPEIPESNARKSGRERVIERARRDNLTVRQ